MVNLQHAMAIKLIFSSENDEPYFIRAYCTTESDKHIIDKLVTSFLSIVVLLDLLKDHISPRKLMV